MAKAAAVVLVAVVTLPLIVLLPQAAVRRLLQWVCLALLGAFDVRLDLCGDIEFGTARLGRGALVVNNHVSWLDVIAVNAVRPMRSLAKAEISKWPVIGPITRAAGTIFVDRQRLSTLPGTVATMADTMRSGALVNVCAEGTTWCGVESGRFKTAPFQAAIDAGVPVRPIALSYLMADGTPTTWPAFIGDDTLIDCVRRVARLSGLTVEVHVGDEIAPGRASDRRHLAGLAEAEVTGVLTATRALD